MDPETAGDPMSAQRWVRSSLRSVSRRLHDVGHGVSPPTVGRVLKGMDYALHVNTKQREARSRHPNRDTQFTYIADQRRAFTDAGFPLISVDSKKKELIGAFKNAGQTWGRTAEAVNVHDFLSEAAGRAVPYGIYDLTHNHGTVALGSSGDTAAFAVDAIARWWEERGRVIFPDATHLLIVADGGGSNDARSHLWKRTLQEILCDHYGLTVTVCHYPPGCSKWNPIEHRLFGPISTNWAGKPLHTWETMLAYLRGTTTTAGLTVDALRLEGTYPTGLRVSKAEMKALHLTPHITCPAWNYTLSPRPPAPSPPSKREVIV